MEKDGAESRQKMDAITARILREAGQPELLSVLAEPDPRDAYSLPSSRCCWRFTGNGPRAANRATCWPNTGPTASCGHPVWHPPIFSPGNGPCTTIYPKVFAR